LRRWVRRPTALITNLLLRDFPVRDLREILITTATTTTTNTEIIDQTFADSFAFFGSELSNPIFE